MTDRELLELLVTKVTGLEEGQTKLKEGQTKLEEGQEETNKRLSALEGEMKEGFKRLDDEVATIKADVKDVKVTVEKIDNRLDELDAKNGSRHREITKQVTEVQDDIKSMHDNIVLMEAVSAKNMGDIAKLKLIK